MNKINGMNVFECNYDKYKGKTELSSLEAEGIAFRFYRWLEYYGLNFCEEKAEDVYNNLSGIRDGNRLDIHDNYYFTEELEIIYLYSVNGTVWAVLYDKVNGKYYGEVEVGSEV